MEDAPDVHVMDDLGNEAKLRNGAPESLRHVWQWQLAMLVGRVLLEYLMAPHRHPPLRTDSAPVGMFTATGAWGEVVISICRVVPMEAVIRISKRRAVGSQLDRTIRRTDCATPHILQRT